MIKFMSYVLKCHQNSPRNTLRVKDILSFSYKQRWRIRMWEK